jgi:type II secretory pathway component PulK
MDNYQLGGGSFSIKIVDMERKFNVNTADPAILRRAMDVVGVDSADASAIAESIQDWRDPDENARISGAESAFYRATPNEGFVPHYSKNASIDDIQELLMVRGVTPEIFWGPGANGAPIKTTEQNMQRMFNRTGQMAQHVGLIDLFSPFGRQVNVNTASAAVLQLVAPIDENVAQAIIEMRAGPDGVEGTEDDTPFRNPGQLASVAGIRQQDAALQRYFTVRSTTFEVHVQARIENYRREYVAVLRRNSPRDIQIFSFYWK